MIENMRNEYFPSEVTPPGETLRDILDERSISQTELATRMGRPVKTVSEIVNAKTTITPETALQLETVLGVPASFWTVREQHYREYLARLEQEEALKQQVQWVTNFPYRELKKYGYVPAARSKSEKLKRLLEFFGVVTPSQWDELHADFQVAFRTSAAFKADRYALAAWLRAGVLEAEEIHCSPFDRSRFLSVLEEVRGLTQEPPEVFQPALIELCSTAGVAVALVPQLPKSRASGATRWLGPRKALIQLSLRYKTDDHLWFTFFHEAAHILLHAKKAIFIEGNGDEGEAEDEANEWASDFLIPPEMFSKIRKARPYSKAQLRVFADRIGISPGIIVGRLQHEGLLPHTHCNDLKQRFQWVLPSEDVGGEAQKRPSA